jgi:ubiquinone/menaquinone biosynthesis C-methylase UbiE
MTLLVHSLLVTLLVTAAAMQRSSAPTIATDKILDAIGVKEGLTVCEMGAGDGELSVITAKAVGASGRVYTSELGEERVKTLRMKTGESGLSHITVIEGAPEKTNFPEGACDALFMRNVYHHFANPPAINASILASLKPGARAAVVDFTPPDKEAERPEDRGKDGMHGVKPETVTRELTSIGLEAVSSEAGDARWFLVVVRRPPAK